MKKIIITPKEYARLAIELGESQLKDLISMGVYKVEAPIDIVSLLNETREKYFGEHVFKDMVAEVKASFDAEKQRRGRR